MNRSIEQAIPWSRVVELARAVERSKAATGTIDPEASARLARAVLEFQEQLVGAVARSSARSRGAAGVRDGEPPGAPPSSHVQDEGDGETLGPPSPKPMPT